MWSDVRATFPTGLKELYVTSGTLDNTNTGDVSLVTFESWCHRKITSDDLERLPKTLKKIEGRFEPASLKDHLREMFPLL